MKKNFVLITGASSGLGLEFAKLAAAKGFNLILVARRKSAIDELAETLRSQYKISVHTIARDLSIRSAPEEIFNEVNNKIGTGVDILINNAGFGTNGDFSANDLQTELDQIAVNISALVSLTHLFIRGMKERKRGIIINVASTAAYQPGPFMAVYYASKAFVKNFSLAIRKELKNSDITVTLFSPGPTLTEFHKRAKMKETIVANELFMMNAKETAKIGFEAALRGKKEVIPGLKNKLGVLAVKLLPEPLIINIVSFINKRRIQ